MRVIWSLGIALLAGIGQAQECSVAVKVSNPAAVPAAALVKAKAVASEIFAGIGVDLRWDGKRTGDAGTCLTRIEVRLGTASGPDERPDSLAYTTVGMEADRRIHIFVDRVNAMVTRSETGMLLGHVLAHEIAHVLEGMARHSESGVMKAHWGRKDLRALLWHPLRFEAVDGALIRAGLRAETAGAND